jgi:hypothetical protein
MAWSFTGNNDVVVAEDDEDEFVDASEDMFFS